MSATGIHPEPSAKAPWTRTIVLTAAYAGDGTARAAPVRRAAAAAAARTVRRLDSDGVIGSSLLAGFCAQQYVNRCPRTYCVCVLRLVACCATPKCAPRSVVWGYGRL